MDKFNRVWDREDEEETNVVVDSHGWKWTGGSVGNANASTSGVNGDLDLNLFCVACK